MSAIVQCPNCEYKVRIRDAALGKRIKCPECSKPFLADAAPDLEDEPARKRPRQAGSDGDERLGNRRRIETPDEDDQDRQRRSPRRKKLRKKSRSNALAWIIGGTVIGLVVLLAGGFGIYKLTQAGGESASQAPGTSSAVGGAAGSGAGWQTVSSARYGFSVALPRAPEVVKTPTSEGFELALEQRRVVIFAICLDQSGSNETADQRMQATLREVTERGGRIVAERASTLGGRPAKEFEAASSRGHAKSFGCAWSTIGFIRHRSAGSLARRCPPPMSKGSSTRSCSRTHKASHARFE